MTTRNTKSAAPKTVKTSFVNREGNQVLKIGGKLTSVPVNFDKEKHGKLTAKSFDCSKLYNEFRANLLEGKATKFDAKAWEARAAVRKAGEKVTKFENRADELRAAAEEIRTGKVSKVRTERKIAKMLEAIAVLEAELASDGS